MEDGVGFLAVDACYIEIGFGFGFGGVPRFFLEVFTVTFDLLLIFHLQNQVRGDNPAVLASVTVFGGFTLGAMVIKLDLDVVV